MHTQNVKTAAPESSERWGEKSCLRTDGFIRNLHSSNAFDVIRADVVLIRMEAQANRGCGLHYEIYESRLLGAAMCYLEKLPVKDRPVFMGAAARRGYSLTLAHEQQAHNDCDELMAELARDY
ncbi:hypothetical protein U7210_003404 [Escherichia coli]|uniref:hypothetical protein n=1 Tax=Enterobacteriaceae TaxID=543 RepID=UPI0023F811D7|nr:MULTISPECIES: hypothetical protein [Enterobacteriaceae]MDJ9218117.1 hypothetical protein [Salmonella enterica]ELR8757041.1 hypothetical protein [Escherichia coli]ELU5570882.1 hypothetical protein [Escherichia coli]EMB1337937.1 hypothetical protein [Escherichia coli]MDF7600371.1 hypothetical protein [Escherichia coli]